MDIARRIVISGPGVRTCVAGAEAVKARVIRLYKTRYPDFGPTLATEKLLEIDGIRISDETLRKWLLAAGIWQKRRKRSAYRQWRPRRSCFGEPAMDSFKGYVKKYGLPISVYLDRHTTYKSPRKPTEWDDAEAVEFLSQFERALKELGVEVIHAQSPQAKGRVERLFGVLQDRLVKEMRLRDIKTKDEANTFLKTYLSIHNKRFRVWPANETDAHVKLPDHFNLDKYLCIKAQRTVRKDNIVAYHKSFTNWKKMTAKRSV